MCEPPSAWDLAAPAPAPSTATSAPTVVSVQIHPGASFHLHPAWQWDGRCFPLRKPWLCVGCRDGTARLPGG
eukprot:10848807-Alexandrium_andersonii.AAC.1